MGSGDPIQIEVDAFGNLTFSTHKYHAKRGDMVTWTCNGNPFTIQFIKISPLEWASGRHRDSGALAGTVQSETSKGTYEYACAVCIGGEVYMDAACPAIIIDP